MGGVGRMGEGEGGHTHRKLITGQQQGIDCANKGEWIMIQLSSGLRCKSAYFVGKYIPHSSKEGNQSKFDQVGGLPGLFISLFRSKSIEPDPVILIVPQPHRIPNCNQPNRL